MFADAHILSLGYLWYKHPRLDLRLDPKLTYGNFASEKKGGRTKTVIHCTLFVTFFVGLELVLIGFLACISKSHL